MVNYDAVYGGRTPLGLRPPWDIGEPQPPFAGLEEAGGIRGEVLDAGCGTGEHALLLAARGHRVTGVDISAVAVEAARAKAVERAVRAEFAVGDAFELPGYRGRFDTVIDCGLLDVCAKARQPAYAAALHRACRPGASVYLLELSAESTELMREHFTGLGVPEQHLAGLPLLTKDDVRQAFADGWSEEWLEEAAMRVSMPGTGTGAGAGADTGTGPPPETGAAERTAATVDVPALWAAYSRR